MFFCRLTNLTVKRISFPYLRLTASRMNNLFSGSVFVFLVFSCFFFLPVKVISYLQCRLVNFALLLVSRRNFNNSPSLQTGVILLLPLSVV